MPLDHAYVIHSPHKSRIKHIDSLRCIHAGLSCAAWQGCPLAERSGAQSESRVLLPTPFLGGPATRPKAGHHSHKQCLSRRLRHSELALEGSELEGLVARRCRRLMKLSDTPDRYRRCFPGRPLRALPRQRQQLARLFSAAACALRDPLRAVLIASVMCLVTLAFLPLLASRGREASFLRLVQTTLPALPLCSELLLRRRRTHMPVVLPAAIARSRSALGLATFPAAPASLPLCPPLHTLLTAPLQERCSGNHSTAS